MTDRRTAGRVLAGGQITIGLATVALARTIAGHPWHGLSPAVMTQVVRVLGARQIVQGIVTATAPRPLVLRGGALVDTSHSLSMIPVAAEAGPYQRAATFSAVQAGTLAVAGYLVARRVREG